MSRARSSRPQDEIAWGLEVLESLIEALPEVLEHHGWRSPLYPVLASAGGRAAEAVFSDPAEVIRTLQPFGEVCMPYQRLGKVDTVDILNLDELMLFTFYWRARHLYRRVADLGANVGWHSLVLDRCGYEVRAWEPDATNFVRLQATLARNACSRVVPIRKAVSMRSGSARFVRVLGNETANHLAGAKPNPYGDLEYVDVELEAYRRVSAWADLVKMDIEGHEAELLCATDSTDWEGTDVVAEVGSAENAERLFRHLSSLDVGIFCQSLGWQRAERSEQLPTHYSQGSVFLSRRPEMPW